MAENQPGKSEFATQLKQIVKSTMQDVCQFVAIVQLTNAVPDVSVQGGYASFLILVSHFETVRLSVFLANSNLGL